MVEENLFKSFGWVYKNQWSLKTTAMEVDFRLDNGML